MIKDLYREQGSYHDRRTMTGGDFNIIRIKVQIRVNSFACLFTIQDLTPSVQSVSATWCIIQSGGMTVSQNGFIIG